MRARRAIAALAPDSRATTHRRAAACWHGGGAGVGGALNRDAVARCVMISIHADWAVGDPEAFATALHARRTQQKKHHALVTVGVVPVRPGPGFGYIQPGDDVATARARGAVHREADRARAETMVRDGYLWNSGIFVWRAGDFLDE
jgi:mannose-1-phosphate guanylyltransferase